MPSRLNQLTVSELSQRFAGVDTCFFVDFTGLSGRRAAALRDTLRTTCGAGASLTVVKTSLMRQALAEIEGLSEVVPAAQAYVEGPTAVAYGADDPVTLARTLADWHKKEKVLGFKGGLLEGKPLSAAVVSELAKIPPKDILMGQVVGTLAGPLTSFLGVTQGVIRKLLALVDALVEKQSEGTSE